MFGILFKVKVKPEKRQAFIDFIKWDIQVAKEREPGTLRFDLYQDPADENAFFVYEAYRDRKAFEEHQKNLPYQQWELQIRPEVVADFKPLFDGDAAYSVEMEENIMANGETLKKITGDVVDEAGEATYRLAASLLVNIVEAEAVKRLDDTNPIKEFLKNNPQLGEAVISFGLAAVIELALTSKLGDAGSKLPYQLRVLFYQKLGVLLLSETPLVRWIEDEALRAIHLATRGRTEELVELARRLAKVELEPGVQPTSDARKAAEAGAGHEEATKAKA
jgi:(4S)-4-hydroxy-5-phosphonooxypentane-2,3-dione isomerase